MIKKILISIFIFLLIIITLFILYFCKSKPTNNTNLNQKKAVVTTIPNPKVTPYPLLFNTNVLDSMPKYIFEIENNNYDTPYWQNANLKTLVNQLKSWNNIYHENNLEIIIKNSDKIPLNLIRLSVTNPESIPFVAGYIKTGYNPKISSPILSSYQRNNDIPILEQWNKNWGYNFYGDEPLAIDGSGPTALSMVVCGLTQYQVTPLEIANLSYKLGCYTKKDPSTKILFTKVASNYGLTAHSLNNTQIIQEVKNGNPVIVSYNSNNTLFGNQFVVLTGISQTGKLMVNATKSLRNSSAFWPQSTILKGINFAYSYILTSNN